MDDVPQPRWGNQARDRKAAAIRGTLLAAAGRGIDAGAWLDVGCGSGGIAASLATNVRSIVGIDPEPWPQWVDLQERHANLTYHVGSFDCAELPLADGSADVVICNQVYEHVADPLQLIKNIQRVLRPGGVCYFAGPNLLWPIEPHVFWPLVHWLPRHAARPIMRILGSRRHDELDAWSTHLWRLRGWFAEAGLSSTNLLRHRICVECEMRKWTGLARAARLAPAALYAFGLPMAPGFIFLLSKA